MLRYSAAQFIAVAMIVSLYSHPESAAAHAIVIDSIPAEGASLPQSPAQVVLRFNARIVPSLAVVDLVFGNGARIALPVPPVRRAAASPDRLAVPLPPLKRGSYTLRYKVLATDGHATLGILHFSVR